MLIAKCVRNDLDDRLEIGKEYKVKEVNMGQSYTSILMTDGKAHNSVLFEFYEDNKPIDIYKDARFNPYIKRK